ncbi:hypothetical protein F5887DRAFT_904574, partial [Amanita rubescens]
ARIAKSNPRLKTFSLTSIPPTHPLPISFSIVPFRARASESFTLTCDDQGLPLSLLARESSRFMGPWVGVSSRKKSIGPRGAMSLLFERSSTREEMQGYHVLWVARWVICVGRLLFRSQKAI